MKIIKLTFLIIGIFFFESQSYSQILSNGGFESGLTGWGNQAGGGGAASFSITTADKYSGNQSFQIAVSALGANTCSIQTLGPSWSAGIYKTYSRGGKHMT